MKRNLPRLTNKVYDVVVVGGGIYGAWVALDASLRGLSVALLEKLDFGSATSSNSLKIIHGGLRYLQHLDFKRMRESIIERRTMMKVAPHLIHPLPIVIPTYGHGMKGKEVLSLAIFINDLLSIDRNRSADPQKYIPRGSTLSRKEVMGWLPGIQSKNLTGGVLFHDAQVYNTERLLLSILHSAVDAGADVTNYLEVVGVRMRKDAVSGVKALDVLTGDQFEIQGKMIVNTCGPWVSRFLDFLKGRLTREKLFYSKAFNLVTRRIFKKYAVGINGQTGYNDGDTVVNKGGSFIFFTPWRGYSLIGTGYSLFEGDPGDIKPTDLEVSRFVKEINQACPSAELKKQDISFIHGGLLPNSGRNRDSHSIKLARHYQIHDHRKDGVKGLVSVVGVKYTTARFVAERTVDLICQTTGHHTPRSLTSITPLHGGEIEQYDSFLTSEMSRPPNGLEKEDLKSLIDNYGSAYGQVLRYVELSEENGKISPINRIDLTRAEVRHAVRQEMAYKLSDVVFRRTEIGTVGPPDDGTLEICAETIGSELGWSRDKISLEIKEVHESYPVNA